MLTQKKKRTEQEIRDALRKIDNLSGRNFDDAKSCINEWIANGYQLNTTFKFGTNFKHAGRGGESFPWKFSLLEYVGRFCDHNRLSSLVAKGLDPKFKCGGRSAFQVIMQSPTLYYDSCPQGADTCNIIKVFLEIGVEPNIINSSGRTPLEYLLKVRRSNSLKELNGDVKGLLKEFLTADEVKGRPGARMNLEYQHQVVWDLQTENAALRQRVEQLECEKEEIVKTPLTDVKVDDIEVGAQRG